jgi:hypothetical protein
MDEPHLGLRDAVDHPGAIRTALETLEVSTPTDRR